jgi:hypothetical protein
MAFNVMARNCDDHTKNFAFLLQEGASWTLAPAYDVTQSLDEVRDAIERWPTFARKAEVSAAQIARVAKDFQLV